MTPNPIAHGSQPASRVRRGLRGPEPASRRQALHLSQSAISHALRACAKPCRTSCLSARPSGMEPTARALAMAAPLREALRSIHDTLGVRPFEPATASRTFVLAANDYVTSVLLTGLSRRVAALAPRLDLVVRPSDAAGPGRADRRGPHRHRHRHLRGGAGALPERAGLDAGRRAGHAQGPSAAPPTAARSRPGGLSAA